MEALVKAILATIVVVGMLIASFYLAYAFVLLLAVLVVGTIAYTWFNRNEWLSKPYFDD